MTDSEEMAAEAPEGAPEEAPFRCACPDCRALRNDGRQEQGEAARG